MIIALLCAEWGSLYAALMHTVIPPTPPDFDERVRRWDEARREMVDRSQRYIQLVFSIGYAGFFAVWSGTRQQLKPWEAAFSAALVTASLLGYLFYEVLSVRMFSLLMVKAVDVITKDWGQFYVTVKQYMEDENAIRTKMVKLGNPVFYFTMVTGFGGGAVLLVAFAKRLWFLAYGG